MNKNKAAKAKSNKARGSAMLKCPCISRFFLSCNRKVLARIVIHIVPIPPKPTPLPLSPHSEARARRQRPPA